MTENKKHTGFEEGFRESFGDFRQMPDPAVWSRIEAGLRRRRKVILFYRLAAAASLALLFSIAGWLVFHSYQPDAPPPAIVSQEPLQEFPETKAPELPDEDILKPFEDYIQESKDRLAQTIEEQKEKPAAVIEIETEPVHIKDHEPGLQSPIITEPAPIAEIISPLETEEIPGIETPGIAEIIAEDTQQIAEKELPDITDPALLLQTGDFLPEKPQERKWQLALGYGTIQGQALSDPKEAYESTSANFRQDRFSSKLSAETGQFSSVENTSHSQPLTIGFLVNRNFSDSWGIETGLMMTRLKTFSTTSITNDTYAEYGSELFYLGVPVSIRLNMIRGRRLGMYLSQGAVLEKGIRTRYYSNYYVFDVLQNSEDKVYVAEGVQISSLTALGFEFRLTDLLSIYAQPGLQIFFLNQTQPYNIRSSSAIWPSFQTGLKFIL